MSQQERNELKAEIEAAAQDAGCTINHMISTMQALAARVGNEDAIGELHDLKMEYYRAGIA